jgi:hypothetical protein
MTSMDVETEVNLSSGSGEQVQRFSTLSKTAFLLRSSHAGAISNSPEPIDASPLDVDVTNPAVASVDESFLTSSVMSINDMLETTTTEENGVDELDSELVIKGENVCRGSEVGILVAILVTSAPSHAGQRDTIRQTWGHFALRRDVRVAFVVGSSDDTKIDRKVADESLLYGDVIQFSFVDSYNNLTSKVLSMLQWASKYCGATKFLLKTDDDMFINVPVLLNFLRARENVTNVIYGRMAAKWKPARSKKSKWFVTTSEYKNKFYPNFVTGPAYLMSYDCVGKLLKQAEGATLFKLEDVFTTGILAEKAGIKREGVAMFTNTRPKLNNTCALSKIISAHDVKNDEMFDIWRRLQDPTNKKCTKT